MPLSEPSTVSSNLLRGVQASDQAAWVRLVNAFYPMVYTWCRQAGLGPEDAADTCQEVFQSVATSIPRFRRAGPDDTFRGWLRQITRRRLVDFRRRRYRQPQATGGSDAVRDTGYL